MNEIEKIKIEHNFSAVSQSVFNIAFFCIIKLFQNEEKGKMEYIQMHTNTHKPPASKTTDQKKTNWKNANKQQKNPIKKPVK